MHIPLLDPTIARPYSGVHLSAQVSAAAAYVMKPHGVPCPRRLLPGVKHLLEERLPAVLDTLILEDAPEKSAGRDEERSFSWERRQNALDAFLSCAAGVEDKLSTLSLGETPEERAFATHLKEREALLEKVRAMPKPLPIFSTAGRAALMLLHGYFDFAYARYSSSRARPSLWMLAQARAAWDRSPSFATAEAFIAAYRTQLTYPDFRSAFRRDWARSAPAPQDKSRIEAMGDELEVKLLLSIAAGEIAAPELAA